MSASACSCLQLWDQGGRPGEMSSEVGDLALGALTEKGRSPRSRPRLRLRLLFTVQCVWLLSCSWRTAVLDLADVVVFDKNTCLLWIPHSLHFITFTINVRVPYGPFCRPNYSNYHDYIFWKHHLRLPVSSKLAYINICNIRIENIIVSPSNTQAMH